MKRPDLFILIMALLTACAGGTKWDIKGSWYLIGHDGLGHHDKEISYWEAYLNDSIINFTGEVPGEVWPRRYKIIGDSVWEAECLEKECQFIAMYKIIKLENDTLWMSVNPSYGKGSSRFWVRLPAGEKGKYDHVWTSENRDSLNVAVYNDYLRRTFRYFSTPEEYDAALKAGEFKWTMKDVRAWEDSSRKNR